MILPLVLLASITQEASCWCQAALRRDQSGRYFQQRPRCTAGLARGLLDRFGVADLGLLQKKAWPRLGNSSQALTSRALGIGQVTLDFVVRLLRDAVRAVLPAPRRRELSRAIARAIPLQPDHTQRLLEQFATVVRATVKGNIVVALVQGALGGLAFLVLGVPGAVLWGAVMALLSLLPAIGAAMVWAPVARPTSSSPARWWQGIGLTRGACW